MRRVSVLFEQPTDHYHLVVWFEETSKPADLAFHRRSYNWVHGLEWNSSKVCSERGIVQYIQCEPRELVELYSSVDHAKFIQHCWETRSEMHNKIDARDKKKKAAAETVRVNFVHENDWWKENDYSPQAITNVIIEEGIRDVHKFLLWVAKYEPDKTIGSFIYHRDKARLTKEINQAVRRHWVVRSYAEQRDGRRKQNELLLAAGKLCTVEESIRQAKLVVQKNGYN